MQLASQWVPGALGLCLAQDAVSDGSSGTAAATSCSGSTSCCGTRTRSASATTWSIDDNCLLDAKGDTNAGIAIGAGTFIGRNTILSCKNGDIVLGDGANIGFNCEIFSAARVELGARTLLAAYCYVIGGDHDWKDAGRPVLEQGRRAAGVTVGAGAWLGAGAKVLDGTTIGADAIVGAGAVVTADVPAPAIAVGVPARVVGSRVQQAQA